ncbi:MAG: InlB B-repeat-containing protein [Bacilli bacterium]|jgi:uncharacterized repeat protein (TIGR02543 family)|nr:InlB B-repeat-containing protein [Bacilli bacterium]
MKMKTKGCLLFGLIIILILSIVIYFKTNVYYVLLYNDGNLIKTIETRKNRPMKGPEPLEKEGYLFLGWYDENGEIFDFEQNIKGNLKLTAGWAKISPQE